jgi:hypothetical protein
MVVSTLPASPTSATPVTIVVSNVCCPVLQPTIVRNGFVFDIPYGSICLSACAPFTATYDAGLLPPGTYEVRIVPDDNSGPPQIIGTFAVAAGALSVPALDPFGSVILAMLLAAAGAVVTLRLSR